MTTLKKRLAALAAAGLFASGAHAATVSGQGNGGVDGAAQFTGTSAGDLISNTASASYSVNGGAPLTESSNTVDFNVDERIQVDVSVVTTPVSVENNESDAILSFLVTNLGNGNENFTLSIDAVIDEVTDRGLAPGTDFDPTTVRMYPDGGNGICEAADLGGTEITGADDIALVEGGEILICVAGNIPNTVADADEGDVELAATSTTPGASAAAAGDSLSGVGDGSTDAVVVQANGTGSDIGTYLVTGVEVAIVKSIFNVDDQFGADDANDELIPGAIVTYELAITVTGTQTADNLTVVDDILVPDVTAGTGVGGIQYVASSLSVGPNSGSLTGLSDDGTASDVTIQTETVNGSVTLTTNTGGDAINRVVVNFGNVEGDQDGVGTPFTAVIHFDVEIQ